MSKKSLVLAATFAALAVAGRVNAATVSASMTKGTTSPEAVAAGAPANAQVFKFFLTSDADILSVDRVGITGATLFQVDPPFGSDNEPPAPAFIAINRALEADSWISTPGATSQLGPGLPGDGALTTFGDLTNNGAQNNFQYATLTIPFGAQGLFTHRIQIAGAAGPEVTSFSFVLGVPEPATFAMAGMGLIGLVGVSRRRKA